jgi:hypothetical protein
MTWRYIENRVDEVETEVTQRDQFLNEDLNLSDTLVRETVQNSLDAAGKTGPVVVRFRELGYPDSPEQAFIHQLLQGHLPHAQAAGLEIENVNFATPNAIVIEDFGTIGLTGPVDKKGDTNFSDFWRRHGKSHKSGTQRGRHGLGKLVFSCASKLGVFFGSTVRVGDKAPQLMGQCVLNLRKLDEKSYKPHGFYSDVLAEGAEAGLQVPMKDQEFVSNFHHHFKLKRKGESGLSIVIPFPVQGLEVAKMIEIGIVNYFFPILTGQLQLWFNDEEVSASTLRAMTEEYAKDGIHDADARFDFIVAVSNLMKNGPCVEIKDTKWVTDGKLSEATFKQAELEALRETFKAGRLVGLKLPITISHRERGKTISHFHVFIQRPEGLSKGEDFYVRNGLTVPKERRFGDRKSLGALIANEADVAGFLGDAENAAHSSWSGVAEKLKKNFRSGEATLRAIRHSLIQLHDLLAQAVEEEDETALLDVLWVPAEKGKQGTKNKPDKQPTPGPGDDIPKPKPRPIRIEQCPGGFALRPTASTAEHLPITCTISAAYDRLRGDPFAKHSAFDFDFTRKGDVIMNPDKVVVDSMGANWVKVEISEPDFRFEIGGFDPNRDLVVMAVTER